MPGRPTASVEAASWRPDGLELRPVTEEEFARYCEAIARHFGEDHVPDAVGAWRALSSLERSFAAFDGERIVASVQTVAERMAVPGGASVPCAAVTAVTVRPTHRRRGLMTALLARATEDARRRGEPLGALFASEHPIYGRYGYGPAVPMVRWSVPRDRASLDPQPQLPDIDLVEPAEAAPALAAIDAAARPRLPGALDRGEQQWEALLAIDPPAWRDGATARYVAVAPGSAAAIYRLKDDGDPAGGLLRVELLCGVDDEAEAAMFTFLTSVDLVRELRLGLRPPDDPLLARLAHPDRAEVRAHAPMYVRLHDLPAAVAARSYDADDTLVLDVADAFIPDNAGRWRLTVREGRGSLERTDERADLVCDVRELATAYLGGVRPSVLARASRMHEASPGAARRLDRVLATDRAPWQPWDF